jgi:hypothetical protein
MTPQKRHKSNRPLNKHGEDPTLGSGARPQRSLKVRHLSNTRQFCVEAGVTSLINLIQAPIRYVRARLATRRRLKALRETRHG